MSGEDITQEEMDALREVLTEASPTPWQADFGGYHFSTMVGGYDDVGECIEASDGRAIVAVMNAVPRLLAEVERLTVICEEAGVQVGLLEREVERLRIGIERYQNKLGEYCATYRTTAGRCECAVCEWEREDKKRKESGDDAP